MQLIAWQDYLHSTLLGNDLEAWGYAILAALLTLLLLPRAKLHALRQLENPPLRRARWALAITLLERTRFPFFFALAVYLGSQSLALPHKVQRVVEITVIVAVWFQVGLWASAVMVHVLREQLARRGVSHLAFAGGFTVLSFIAQALVWFVAIALALANAGVNIIALIAGLGTGGAALALATRSMLSNLFANATITLDKLFFIGDNLVSGGFEGKVEHVGNRTTHLRSPNGELILISNADLLKSRLRNFGRIDERREVLTLRLSRANPVRKVRDAVSLIEQIIRDEPMARLDRCHFALITLEALQLEAVYYVSTGATPAELRENINAQVHAVFAANAIDMELPVQRIDIALGC
ncbi:MAG TPA: mechanosensitive ion channel domain-containing protein [Steroidobacteraceae bacterium]|nr:mechanosensitive ion channel domain-containing protein [Steroidobacteraceae bacterium]